MAACLLGFSVIPKPTKANKYCKEITIKYAYDNIDEITRNNPPPLIFMEKKLASAAVMFLESIMPYYLEVAEYEIMS